MTGVDNRPGGTAGDAGGADARRAVRIMALELDPTDPPLRLAEWLAAAGAELAVRRVHGDDDVPAGTEGFDALLVLGGALGAFDDDRAPWLARVRRLLAGAVAEATPTLAIGLGAQLLAVATGGRVQAAGGYRLGARLAAKRDVTEEDLLLGGVPITPDVMQFRRDTIAALPAGSVLLLASLDDAVEAFRVGSAAWGLQFHIETTAAALRGWRDDPRRGLTDADRTASERRFGAALDEAEDMMAGTWAAIAGRFVELVRQGIPQTATGRNVPRLPIVASELGG